MSNNPEKNIDATYYDVCAICGENIALEPDSILSKSEWLDSEGYCEGDDHTHTPYEPDGAPREQWEVTTPNEVYRKPEDD